MKIQREINGMTLTIPLSDAEIRNIAAEYNRQFFCLPIEECIRTQYAAFVKAICPNCDKKACVLDDMDDDVRFQAFVHSESAWAWFAEEALTNVAGAFWDDLIKQGDPVQLTLEWESKNHVFVKHGDCFILSVTRNRLAILDWDFVIRHWRALAEFCKAIEWKDVR